jgi:hypothetical protein
MRVPPDAGVQYPALGGRAHCPNMDAQQVVPLHTWCVLGAPEQPSGAGRGQSATIPSRRARTESITSSTPPPIDNRRLSRKKRLVQVSSM